MYLFLSKYKDIPRLDFFLFDCYLKWFLSQVMEYIKLNLTQYLFGQAPKIAISIWMSQWKFPHASHLKSLWPLWMIFMCILRWWEWENDFPQVSHLNFFNHFLHIYSQITIIFTFKIFVMFMNCFDMNPKRSSLSNWFFRRATFHEWFWYDLSS